MKVSGKKTGKLAFEINQDGYTYTLDAPESFGGEGKGPSPKGLLLSGLIGCTGIDVVVILDKMRVEIQDMEITAETELTDQEPSVFKEITLTYHVTGNEKDAKKIKRAVSLSMETYCGVSAILKKHSPIIPKIYLNGKEI
ncbi:MAG: OsmC family protein [Desulfobacterales bacterium]|nr:OsmC family protein [Desulfobacterales bacterium]